MGGLQSRPEPRPRPGRATAFRPPRDRGCWSSTRGASGDDDAIGSWLERLWRALPRLRRECRVATRCHRAVLSELHPRAQSRGDVAGCRPRTVRQVPRPLAPSGHELPLTHRGRTAWTGSCSSSPASSGARRFSSSPRGSRRWGPNGVTFTRILVGFLTLALFPGSRRAIRRDDWLGTALVGVLWMAFPLSMFPYAERHVSSALTGMLNGAVPLFIAIVAAGIARRWPSRGIAAGARGRPGRRRADGAADARPGPQHRARRPADPGGARVLRVRAQHRPPGPAAERRAAGDLAGAGGRAGADRAARPAGDAPGALVARAAASRCSPSARSAPASPTC